MSASFSVDMNNSGFSAMFDDEPSKAAAAASEGAAPSIAANPKNRVSVKDTGTPDPRRFAEKALADARVQKVKEKVMERRAEATLTPAIAAVVKGSQDAAPTKPQHSASASAGAHPAGATATAAPTDAEAVVDRLARASANLKTDDEINKMIAGFTGLEF